MSKVYLPQFTTSNCIVILNKDTIRVYETTPTINSSVAYTDYYINSHYLSKSGITNINEVITCENDDNFTTEVYYRNDLDNILIIFLIFCIFCFWLPFKVVSRILGKWGNI